MKKKSLLNKGKKALRKMGKDFRQSPLARASRGKHTRGFI